MGLFAPPYEWAYCSRTIESIVFLLYLENNGDHVTGSFPLMCLRYCDYLLYFFCV